VANTQVKTTLCSEIQLYWKNDGGDKNQTANHFIIEALILFQDSIILRPQAIW